MNLERELENLRSVGITSNRKMSRVGRSFQESSKARVERKASVSTIDLSSEGKENDSVTNLGVGTGGISFII